jgi:hypothetical protein
MPHRMILLTTCILLFAACGSAAISPWLDASKPIAERVDAIMAEMTLTERIRQLYAVHNYDVSEWVAMAARETDRVVVNRAVK